jgi:RNA polymerase sigma factor (sigma-70 family)
MENVLVGNPPVRLRRPARLLRLASDERLVALVRGGDEGAFEALYDRHHPAILGFCRHMLGTREEAEDAVQHTFLAAFRDLVGSDKAIELRPWLFAIARNRCLSLLRARRPQVALELVEPSTDGLAGMVERREDLRELLADLACLPEDQRAALLLAELGALDHAGIAIVLGCPREKVKALVFQARTSLAASREARATPCEDIRVELATATGAALRRGPLRRHLRTCAGCRAFKAEMATQHKLLALALPVVPGVALKASVLGGGGSASGAGAAGSTTIAAGTASSATNGALGGMLGTFASSGAGKAAVSLALAGAVAGGGALTERLEHRMRSAPARPRLGPSHAAPAPPIALGAPASPRTTRSAGAFSPGGLGPARRATAAHPGGTGAEAPSRVPSPLPPAHAQRRGGVAHPSRPAQAPASHPAPPAGGVRRHGSAPPPPSQGTPPGTRPTQRPSPPGHAHGTPPSTVPPAHGGGSARSGSQPTGGPAPSAAVGGKPSPPPSTGASGNASGQATPSPAAPTSSPGASGGPGSPGGADGPSHGQSGAAHGHGG